MFEVNNGNTRTVFEISSKLTVKRTERNHWRCSGICIVNFEPVSHIHCWHWTSECWLWKDCRKSKSNAGPLLDSFSLFFFFPCSKILRVLRVLKWNRQPGWGNNGTAVCISRISDWTNYSFSSPHRKKIYQNKLITNQGKRVRFTHLFQALKEC